VHRVSRLSRLSRLSSWGLAGLKADDAGSLAVTQIARFFCSAASVNSHLQCLLRDQAYRQTDPEKDFAEVPVATQ
jgi:hypothetical protein